MSCPHGHAKRFEVFYRRANGSLERNCLECKRQAQQRWRDRQPKAPRRLPPIVETIYHDLARRPWCASGL